MSVIRESLHIPVTAQMGPLLVLSLILVAGLSGGWVARRLRVPSVTGNILAGIFIGPACLNLFSDQDVITAMQPMSTFAMALITAGIGSQLSYNRLHNAWRRVVSIALGEVLFCFLLVIPAVWLLGASWPVALVLGCIAVNSSPATIVAIIRETRSKGTFVKTLLAVVGLDNMISILMFAFARTLLADYYVAGAVGIAPALLQTLWQLGGALALGYLIGYVTERLVHHPQMHDFSTVFIAILLCAGVSTYFGFSPLLTSLVFGLCLGNASEEASRQTQALEPIELLLFICFFTMAGVSLHLETAREAGLLCVAYLGLRFLGKLAGGAAGGRVAGTTRRIWLNMGIGLMPQAGVAIGMVVLLGGDARIPEAVSGQVAAIVLAGVALAEIFGPFFTRLSLRRANEVNKDRRRLIEFLQEEYILTGLRAADKWEALRKVTDFYIRTHRIAPALREALHQSIIERERDGTTAIGLGAAIPHGRIGHGGGIRGVLAICSEGVAWGEDDDESVRLVMLVVTPAGHDKEHIEVMASLAQMISDATIRTRLLAAMDANDAWEVIEGEETRNYNYFLDEKEQETAEEAA
ncbi:MAG: cation:proton antiporter [Candidatus Hydrogenedentes bacterium]|nr:cation:proton antiporter [Candidatus Hydrogenedentota bacterium]